MTGKTGITGIDHVVIVVRALEEARASYERLGFTLTPIGRHTKLDTANHCIMLAENTYFELLTVVRPQPLNAAFGAVLKDREGIAAVALKTEDARAAVPKLAEAGLGPSAAVDFGRPVELSEGKKDARFTVVHLDDAKTPGGRMFLCQQHTPELVWLKPYLEHKNRARGVKRVTLVANDPKAAAAAHGVVFGAEAKAIEGGFEVATGNAALRVLSASAFRDAYPGEDRLAGHAPVFAVLTLSVADPDAAGVQLKREGIAVQPTAGGIRIAAAAAAGAVLELVS
jgi:catechol 2,3-dioxygenase-like lactoylglutathione lyase family enzyme